MIPNVPPAAIAPENSFGSYPSRSACGMATVATVAAVATDEPEVAENIVAVATLAWTSPPGIHDTHLSSAE